MNYICHLCFFLNCLLLRLRPAIVYEGTFTLQSLVSLHSSAALSSASVGRYKEHGASLRVSMCAFCVCGTAALARNVQACVCVHELHVCVCCLFR